MSSYSRPVEPVRAGELSRGGYPPGPARVRPTGAPSSRQCSRAPARSDPPRAQATRANGASTLTGPVGTARSTTAARPPGRTAASAPAHACSHRGTRDSAQVARPEFEGVVADGVSNGPLVGGGNGAVEAGRSQQVRAERDAFGVAIVSGMETSTQAIAPPRNSPALLFTRSSPSRSATVLSSIPGTDAGCSPGRRCPTWMSRCHPAPGPGSGRGTASVCGLL